jgi:hypothetical protein
VPFGLQVRLAEVVIGSLYGSVFAWGSFFGFLRCLLTCDVIVPLYLCVVVMLGCFCRLHSQICFLSSFTIDYVLVLRDIYIIIVGPLFPCHGIKKNREEVYLCEIKMQLCCAEFMLHAFIFGCRCFVLVSILMPSHFWCTSVWSSGWDQTSFSLHRSAMDFVHFNVL